MKLVRLLFLVLICLGLLAPSVTAAVCGDCNNDAAVDIMDAFTAARHAVLIITLTPTDFQNCNVAGDPGPPTAPGMPVVNVLDAVRIAQVSVGLPPPLSCGMLPIVSAGPFDLKFGGVPTETVSDQPFQVSVFVYIQGSLQPAIPATPLLVTVSRNGGTGTLRGSVRQWITMESQSFGNLIYAPVEAYTLRCSAGAPHTDDVSATINNRISVEADEKGGLVTGAGPHPSVRFTFRGAGLAVPVASGNFDWTITEIATSVTTDMGTVALAGQTFIDVPVNNLPNTGLYRVYGELRGTPAHDAFPYVRAGTVGIDSHPTISSGRVGVPYTETIMSYENQAIGAPGAPPYTPPTFGPYTAFLVLPEQLPPGLAMGAGGLGTVSGTPATPGFYPFTAFGVTAGGSATRFAVHMAIFSPRDTEIELGIDFSMTGPFAVSTFDNTYNFTNWWDCSVDSTTARFYFPTNANLMRRLPAMTWIHGNGFSFQDYDLLYNFVASYGYVIGSMNNPGYPASGCNHCDASGGGPGYTRATGFQDSVIDKFRELDAGTMAGAPASAAVLVNHIDFDNLFYGGHSRGGSTTFCNLYWKPYLVRGVVPSMQVDPVQQGCGYITTAPCAPIPMLTFFAENDGDVIFPLAEEVVDDHEAKGMTTAVTLYGACHGQFTDSSGCGSTPTALRARVQELSRHMITAFFERQTRGDLRLEGQLYLGEWESSNELGVFGQRDFNGMVYVDDHQDAPAATNLTTGPNSSVTITISETNTYPPYTGRSLKHRRFGFGSGSGTNTWSAPVATPVDTSGAVWLTFRTRQYDCLSLGCLGTSDWSWLTTYDITLTDGTGVTSTFDLRPLFPPATALSKHQRFHRYSVPLTTFAAAAPGFNPASIQSVRFSTGPAGTSSRFVAVDDVRFE